MTATTQIDRRFVERAAFATATRALPTEMLRESSRRLSVVALVIAGLWTNAFVLNMWVFPRIDFDTPIPGAWPLPAAPIALGMIAASLGIAWYARGKDRETRHVLQTALIYEVIVAAAIAMVTYSEPVPYEERDALSFIVIVILLFPMIVPNSPGKTLVTGLCAASMGPLGMAIATWRGFDPPTAAEVLFLNLPAYMFSFVAVLPAHILTRLGRQVTEARELGAYRLVDRIGAGGMGEVWRAEHRMLARPAAIKLIRPEVLGAAGDRLAETTLKRFEREAQATAALRSPHTIELYDFGIDERGVFYYVMELLDGFDLQTLVARDGPVAASRTVYLLRQACRSLAEAHGAGMIHRDIKPANVFTCRMGLELDFVKVLDFGLVKTGPGAVPGSDVQLTADQTMSGTPAFMAPEIIAGDREPDARVDVYALGCVAYWLLTGHLVFEASTGMKMVLRHAGDDPVPPSRRTEREIPRLLEEVVLACLAKNPDGRPASAAELESRLAATRLDRGWTAESREQWWEIHRPSTANRRLPVENPQRDC